MMHPFSYGQIAETGGRSQSFVGCTDSDLGGKSQPSDDIATRLLITILFGIVEWSAFKELME